jgi:hypothetical protein
LNTGGAEFTLIPCLNDHPIWIDTLEKMVTDTCMRSERILRTNGAESSRPRNPSLRVSGEKGPKLFYRAGLFARLIEGINC